MLQKLRDQTQSFGFKLLAGLIVFVLAIFGFGAFNLFLTTDPKVATVDGEGITQSELLSATERERRRIAMQFGQEFDPSMIDPVRLQSMVLDQLITRTLLENAADDFGIAVSQSRVDETVASNPSFQVDGKFQADLYRRSVQAMGYSPQQFLREMGKLLALEQLQNGITQTGLVTDWELRQSARLLNQHRDLAYLPFTGESFSSKVVVSDEDIELRYEENQLDYRTEETVDVAYVELTAESLINDASIKVSEEQIHQAYDAEAAAAQQGDRRRSRHILVQVNDKHSAEQANALLLDLRDRLEHGADFAELAREYSEDPGSAAEGGDLGMVGKGVFDPAFEQALWSLKVGEISQPVKTDFGYHLIRLDEIEVVDYPPFEKQRAEIELRLRRDQAAVLFADRLRELDNLAFEQPHSLDGMAAEMHLQVQSASGVSRTKGEGVFANAPLRDALFANDVLENGYNTPAVEMTDNRAVVARITAHHEPEPIPLDDVRDDIRAELVAERARVLADEAHQAALTRIKAGESVSKVANDYGLRWQTFTLAGRNQTEIPQPVLQTAFTLPRPAQGAKSVGSSVLDDGGHAVVTVTRVVDGDLALMADSEVKNLRQFLQNRAGNIEFGALYATLEADASVKRSE